MEMLEWSGFVVVKVNNGGIRKPDGSFIPPRKKGVSDILACGPDGRFWAIEIKRPGGKLTEEQGLFLSEVRRRNGVAFVAWSLEDVERRLGKK